jgi:uncharacterized protein YjlB
MHEHRADGAERLLLPLGDDAPNNPRLPVLLHRGALPAGDPAAAEALFTRNGWEPAWRDGIYPFLHYHPNAHEALAIARGHVRVRLGGKAGVTLDLTAGDVAVLPAGTGHQAIERARDLLVVGAYPPGSAPDQLRDDPEEIEEARQRIAATPDPPCDPVTGRPYPKA